MPTAIYNLSNPRAQNGQSYFDVNLGTGRTLLMDYSGQALSNAAVKSVTFKWYGSYTGGGGTGTITMNGATMAVQFLHIGGDRQNCQAKATGYSLKCFAAQNGTLSMALSLAGAYFRISGAASLEVQYELVRSPITYLSSAKADAGESLQINFAPASSAYTHVLEAQLKDGYKTETNIEAGKSTAEIALPLAWIEQIPDAESAEVRIRLYTKKGNETIGYDERTITMQVPENVVPTLTHTETPVYTVDGVTYPEVVAGGYVQGASALKAEMTAEGAHGSTVTRTTITWREETTTGNVLQTKLLKTSGAEKVVYSAEDSRGRKTTVEAQVEVLAYQLPSIQELTAERVNETGEQSADGQKAKGTVRFRFTKLGNANTSANVKIQTQTGENGGWVTVKEEQTAESIVSFLADGPFALDEKVTFRAVVSDAYASIAAAQRTEPLAMGWVARWIRHDRRGAAFGQASTVKDGFQIREGWEYYVGERKLTEICKRLAPVQSVNGQTGDVEVMTQEAPSIAGNVEDENGSFTVSANSGTQLNAYTAQAAGLYMLVLSYKGKTTFSGRTFLQIGSEARVSIAEGNAYPAAQCVLIKQMAEGEEISTQIWCQTAGTYSYEKVQLKVIKMG